MNGGALIRAAAAPARTADTLWTGDDLSTKLFECSRDAPYLKWYVVHATLERGGS
jgi:hypothetical protein